jgi:diguanylate cyclase (GGDEF)-like protein
MNWPAWRLLRGRWRARELAVYGLLFLALAVAGIWLADDLADGRQRIISDRLGLAAQKSQFMSQWFGSTILGADYVLRDINDKIRPADIDRLASDRQAAAALTDWLGRKLATVPGLAGFSVYDRGCVFVAAANPALIGYRSNQKSCTEPSPRLEDRLYVQYVPAIKSASGRPSILVARHHLSGDGKLLGGALAAIDLAHAQDWISGFPLNPGEVLAVVDGDGILLARSPPLPEAIGTIRPPPGRPDFDNGRSTASYVVASPVDGRRRIYGLSKIEDVPLVLIVGFDLDETLREWRRRAWQLSGGFGVLLVLSVLVLRAQRAAIRQRDEMRRLAATDALTGVANRRRLVEAGGHEVARIKRYGGDCSVLMVDIDHFKRINDSWGHLTGDHAIQALAAAMVASVRDQDMVGRLGGEEFAALLPETDLDGARAIAERLRAAVEGAVAVTAEDGTPVRFTVSIGVAELVSSDASFEGMLNRADKALYRAKGGGRNRVITG